jgi:hypothetical protein
VLVLPLGDRLFEPLSADFVRRALQTVGPEPSAAGMR